MTSLLNDWSRRTFLQTLGAASVAPAARGDVETPPLVPRFAYVGTADSAIECFRIAETDWQPIARVASNRPAFLMLNRAQSVLYVANDLVEHEGLPTATVEAYAIDGQSGLLHLLSRQPLSLSAMGARHISISPRGNYMVVAAYGGGIYNVLPIGPRGELLPPSGITKIIGSGPDPQHQQSAHPHTVLFDRTGRHVLTSDLGSDSLNLFRLAEGKLIRLFEHKVQPGRGPAHTVLHPGGALLYAFHELEGSTTCYHYCEEIGQIQVAPIYSPEPVGFPIAFHPSGQFLYSVSSFSRGQRLVASRIDLATGAVSPVTSIRLESGLLKGAVQMTPDQRTLFWIAADGTALYRTQISPAGDRLGNPVAVTSLPSSLHLALKFA